MSAALAQRASADGELIADVSFALSSALASAQAALRKAREAGLPTPFELRFTTAGVHAVAPLDDILTWQRILRRPRIVAADYTAGRVRITGQYDGCAWTLTSMTHRRITGGAR